MESSDADMMRRAIALAVRSGEEGEYPYGVVIARDGKVIAESINRVAHERDVTRHAEVVAISAAQKALDTVSLDDCTIYVSAEPCVYCSYAIRESRIGRVVYGLTSPHMGGVSKWPVLTDKDISNAMPEVFAEPPEVRRRLHGAGGGGGAAESEPRDRARDEDARPVRRAADRGPRDRFEAAPNSARAHHARVAPRGVRSLRPRFVAQPCSGASSQSRIAGPKAIMPPTRSTQSVVVTPSRKPSNLVSMRAARTTQQPRWNFITDGTSPAVKPPYIAVHQPQANFAAANAMTQPMMPMKIVIARSICFFASRIAPPSLVGRLPIIRRRNRIRGIERREEGDDFQEHGSGHSTPQRGARAVLGSPNPTQGARP